MLVCSNWASSASMQFFFQLGKILSYDSNAYDILINYSMLTLGSLTLWLDARASRLSTSQHRQWWFSFCGVAVFQVGLCYGVDCVGISIVWSAQLGWMLLRNTPWMRSATGLRDGGNSDGTDGGSETPIDFTSPPSTPRGTTPLVSLSQPARRSTYVLARDKEQHNTILMQRFFAYYKTTLLFGLAAMVYYLAVSEIITTIAHGCAVVLGMLLAWIDLKVHPGTYLNPDKAASSNPLLQV
eukprot:m.18955 g.18955  ORF g.18955 m.18955 type:complete len:240 (+) comp10870_c0_seq3:171-890(+)